MAELIATIDVGTNTAHLLLSYPTTDGRIVPLRTETRYVRLGQGVDASGAAHPDALDRLRETMVEFGRLARSAGAERVIAVGTSASRDISRPENLTRFVERHAGFEYRIIDGQEEAYLTSLGAAAAVDLPQATNFVVVDIGGGSTELTYCRRKGSSIAVESITSLDIGSVRLTERCFSQLPPTEAEIASAVQIVHDVLASDPGPSAGAFVMVGAAGTIRALALIARTRTSSGVAGESVVIERKTVHTWRQKLLSIGLDETLAINPDVLGGRADVMAAGVLVLDLIMDHLGSAKCLVSPWGLRHGLAIRYARERSGVDSP